VIAWEFVNIFEVIALERTAPRLVKRIGEPTALEYNLDKIIERAEGINAHLGELERWRVGGWYNDGAKCLHLVPWTLFLCQYRIPLRLRLGWVLYPSHRAFLCSLEHTLTDAWILPFLLD
jgi:hypothetical protein